MASRTQNARLAPSRDHNAQDCSSECKEQPLLDQVAERLEGRIARVQGLLERTKRLADRLLGPRDECGREKKEPPAGVVPGVLDRLEDLEFELAGLVDQVSRLEAL